VAPFAAAATAVDEAWVDIGGVTAAAAPARVAAVASAATIESLRIGSLRIMRVLQQGVTLPPAATTKRDRVRSRFSLESARTARRPQSRRYGPSPERAQADARELRPCQPVMAARRPVAERVGRERQQRWVIEPGDCAHREHLIESLSRDLGRPPDGP